MLSTLFVIYLIGVVALFFLCLLNVGIDLKMLVVTLLWPIVIPLTIWRTLNYEVTQREIPRWLEFPYR